MGTGGCATALQDSLGGQNVVLLAWGRIQNDYVNTCVDLGPGLIIVSFLFLQV